MTNMIEMFLGGITISSSKQDVPFYSRLGYKVVGVEAPAEVAPEGEPETGPKNVTEAYKLAAEDKGSPLTKEERAEVKAAFELFKGGS